MPFKSPYVPVPPIVFKDDPGYPGPGAAFNPNDPRELDELLGPASGSEFIVLFMAE